MRRTYDEIAARAGSFGREFSGQDVPIDDLQVAIFWRIALALEKIVDRLKFLDPEEEASRQAAERWKVRHEADCARVNKLLPIALKQFTFAGWKQKAPLRRRLLDVIWSNLADPEWPWPDFDWIDAIRKCHAGPKERLILDEVIKQSLPK